MCELQLAGCFSTRITSDSGSWATAAVQAQGLSRPSSCSSSPPAPGGEARLSLVFLAKAAGRAGPAVAMLPGGHMSPDLKTARQEPCQGTSVLGKTEHKLRHSLMCKMGTGREETLNPHRLKKVLQH